MGVKSFKKIIQKPTYEEGAVKPGKESPVSQPLFVPDRFSSLWTTKKEEPVRNSSLMKNLADEEPYQIATKNFRRNRSDRK